MILYPILVESSEESHGEGTSDHSTSAGGGGQGKQQDIMTHYSTQL